MLISLEWLSDHVDVGDLVPEELGELLTLRVAEVEEVRDPARQWEGISVARVAAVRPHPGADKLRLVTVDAGGDPMEVVCGAPNVAEGQHVCYAPEGVTLPGGLKLKKRKIRGVESRGMVLSERELGLGEDHEGILVLDGDTTVGTPVAEVLPVGAVIEISNTAITTRPDLWGHYGLAREAAAALDRPLKDLDLGDPFPDTPSQVEVVLESPDLCPRYLGWVIGGIRIEPSPGWLRRRLEQAGQRPINNIVDLTNYILLECGQPLHAFDRRQIVDGKIIVRRARAGERVTTLDDVERVLPEGACVIADPERAVAVAGVMGMANSEVLDDTSEIILEVANFEMTSIRSTSKALGLRTESAVRFEKGLDPMGVPLAARRFFRLLKRICPTAKPIGGPADARGELPGGRTIELDEGWIERRLGTALSNAEEDSILRRLGYGVERADGKLRVAVPSWRLGDTAIPEDLVEDVGRIHGWDRIEPIPLYGELESIPIEPEREAREALRTVLSAVSGFTEYHAYPFTTAEACRRAGIEPGALGVANASQPGLDLLAPSLVPGLLKTVSENLKHRDEVALYVVAPVFAVAAEKGELPSQDEHCAIALARRQGEPGLLELKGAVESVFHHLPVNGVRLQQEEGPAWLHPGRSARLARGKETFGWIGQIHPAVARAFEIDEHAALADLDMSRIVPARTRLPNMQPISRYPTVPYDVAIVADRTTPAGEIQAVLERVDPKLVREVKLFDAYEGTNLPQGKRSLAFSIVFGSFERTLETKDVERLRAAVSSAIQKRGWTLRL